MQLSEYIEIIKAGIGISLTKEEIIEMLRSTINISNNY